jgi:hypothetical protein
VSAIDRRGFLAGIAACALGGCGGSSGQAVVRAPALPSGGASRLYVADATPALLTFALPPLAAGNEAPAARVFGAANTLTRPFTLARAPSGELYVSEVTSSVVKIFAPGATGSVGPAKTLGGSATLLAPASAIAFDAGGRLYAAVPGAGSGSAVLRFAAGASGNVAPELVISGPATTLQQPRAIAVDAAGMIYVGDNVFPNGIKAFAAGANGNVAPAVVFGGTNHRGPVGIAVDADGTVYAADAAVTLPVYASRPANGAEPARQIVLSFDGVHSAPDTLGPLAIDATSLYVVDASAGSVLVLPKTASGNVAPLLAISGLDTTLNGAVALAL